MNMNQLWRELEKIERKNGLRVENCGDNFEFHRLRDNRVVYLNETALKSITKNKVTKQSAKAVMRYVKTCY